MARATAITYCLLSLAISTIASHDIQELIDTGHIKSCFLGNGTLQLSHKNLSSVRGIEHVPYANSVTLIDLSHNNLHSLEGCSFAQFPNLKQLWLNHNHVSDITQLGRLGGLESLQVLNLAHNAITQLPTTSLTKLKNLAILFLQHNQLTVLESLAPLTNLRELHLMHNNLQTLDLEILGALPMLFVVNAGYNAITTITPKQNGTLPHLEVLFLHNNNVRTLPPGALAACPELLALYLQNNQLEYLAPGSLQGLYKLRLLYLQHNALTSLPTALFADLKQLHLLYLNHNKLCNLAPGWQAGLEKLQILDLSYNRLSKTDFSSLNHVPHCCAYQTTTPAEVQQFLSRVRPEVYQDIIVDGITIKEGVKDCEIRYPYIQNILNQYKRPITVLDIGASEGYFSLRVAKDYDATCVMIEGDSTLLLPDICALNKQLNNLVVLEKFITPQDLKELGECEHFDLVIAFNVVHQMKEQWKEALDYLLTLGDHILIETPPPGCRTSANKELLPLIEAYLAQHPQAKVVGRVPRYGRPGLPGPDQKYSNMYLVTMHKNVLPKPTWGSPNFRFYPINSTCTTKTLYKARIDKTLPWLRGINLWTFKHMHGVYPTHDTIKNEIVRLAAQPHSDFLPWNMIVQGNHLELIDWDDNNAPNYMHNAEACLAHYESRRHKR